MLVALGGAAYVRFRYGVGHKKFIRMTIWFVVALGAIMTLSLTSEVTVARCTGDPSEFCRYNANVPFIATVAMVYVVITAGRAFFMHFNR